MNAAVHLYVIRIPIDPTAGAPLTSINLPSGSFPGVHLHVFAVTVH